MENLALSEGRMWRKGGPKEGDSFLGNGIADNDRVRGNGKKTSVVRTNSEETAQTRGGESKGTPSLAEIMSGPTAGSISLYLKGIARQHPPLFIHSFSLKFFGSK